MSASPILAGLAGWRPALHAPAEALRKALAPIGAWALLLAPVTIALELVSRLVVGWWRLTVPAVQWLNKHWILWPLAVPLVLVTHLFLWTLFGAMIGQWMPGIIGNGHAVGRATEAYIAVNVAVMALVGVPARQAPDPETMTGLQQRVLMAVMSVPVGALPGDLKALREGDRPKTRASRPKRVGDSSQVVVTLPAGMDAAKVAAQHTGSVAGSLGLPEDRVVLSADRKLSARDLVVRVLDIALEDRELGHMPVPATQHPFFDGFTFGLDRYGDPVSMALFEHSTLILGAAGSGKSYLARTYGAAAAIDPLVDLHLFSLKVTADFDPLQAVATTFHTGADQRPVRALADALEAASADVDRRGQVLREHGAEKLTRKIATADPSMRPAVFLVDECHVGFQDETYGKRIVKAAADLAKRARYVGIVVVFLSQEGNATDIPRAVSGNTAVGVALRVLTYNQVDNALGTGAYQNGADATKIATSAPGVAYVRGVRPTIEKVKTYGTDLPALREFAEFAAEGREQWFRDHGRPAGPDAADDGPEDAPADLLDHVAKVMGDRPVVTRREILAGLQELDPERYGTWETKHLTRELKGWGIEPDTGAAPGVSGTHAVLRLEVLTAAIAAR